MGQTALDVPDPLEKPDSSLASTDDLLAQLAGDEIDRLLAEADNERPPKPPSTPTDASPSASPTIPTVENATATVSRDVSNDIDRLFTELDSPKSATAKAAGAEAPLPSLPPAEPPAPAGTSPVSEAAAPAAQPASQADQLAADLEDELSASITAARGADSDDEDRPLPLWLKPLEWLNAPLAACPESLRDALGKVGILTLVNSLAIIAYVLLFRRHH